MIKTIIEKIYTYILQDSPQFATYIWKDNQTGSATRQNIRPKEIKYNKYKII